MSIIHGLCGNNIQWRIFLGRVWSFCVTRLIFFSIMNFVMKDCHCLMITTRALTIYNYDITPKNAIECQWINYCQGWPCLPMLQSRSFLVCLIMSIILLAICLSAACARTIPDVPGSDSWNEMKKKGKYATHRSCM